MVLNRIYRLTRNPSHSPKITLRQSLSRPPLSQAVFNIGRGFGFIFLAHGVSMYIKGDKMSSMVNGLAHTPKLSAGIILRCSRWMLSKYVTASDFVQVLFSPQRRFLSHKSRTCYSS